MFVFIEQFGSGHNRKAPGVWHLINLKVSVRKNQSGAVPEEPCDRPLRLSLQEGQPTP
jgi:hypothetical protein